MIEPGSNSGDYKMSSIRKVYTTDDTLNRIQDSIKQVVEPKINDIILNRVELTGTIVTSGTKISHNLGRVPTGWVVVDKTVNADVYRVSWNNETITLASTATTEIKLWVF